MPRSMIDSRCPLLLGSGSPRRRDLLHGLGIPFVVRAADIDETRREAEAPREFLERIVEEKHAAVLALRPEVQAVAAQLVADTIVVLDGEVLGKPADTEDAERLLARLAGRTHTVFTRYMIGSDDQCVARTVETRVTMRSLDPDSIREYARSGEGLDKAGAYAIQGIGAFLVRSIDGSYSNVVGLPACEVVEDLLGLGLLPGFPAVLPQQATV